MAITSVTNTTTASSSDYVYNPNSQLTSDQFMQLFLTELKQQDPTDPMDTDKMLDQTAQLTSLETNTKMEKTLDNLSKSLQSSQQINTISAIGKMADTGNRDITVTDKDTSKDFELYFGDNIESGNVIIKDKNGNTIKTFPLEAHDKGILSFNWDLTDNNGQKVKPGSYEVTADYTTQDGKSASTALGAYPIEAIKFENGEAYAKLGSNYVPFSSIKEIYEWQE